MGVQKKGTPSLPRMTNTKRKATRDSSHERGLKRKASRELAQDRRAAHNRLWEDQPTPWQKAKLKRFQSKDRMQKRARWVKSQRQKKSEKVIGHTVSGTATTIKLQPTT